MKVSELLKMRSVSWLVQVEHNQDQTGSISRVEVNGDSVYMPELLRVKGSMLYARPQHDRADAERCFLRSLELSRAHGSRAWELRTATDLATLWADQARSGEARALLQSVFDQFAEGSDTVDVKAAERLLSALN